MSAFDILLLGHLVGDFLFQTQWMALNKQKRWLPLGVHCIVYTAIVAVFSYSFLDEPLSVWGLLLIFISHVILDQGRFVGFWYRRITMCTHEKSGWLKIVHDQVFHLLILFAVLQL